MISKIRREVNYGRFGFLEDMYEKINVEEDNKIKVICPNCEHEYEVAIGFKRK